MNTCDTPQKQGAEPALSGGSPAQAQALLEALMDNIPDWIYFKDTLSRFLKCSKTHAKRLGISRDQVVGKSDKIGAYPSTTPYAPDDLGATVYHVLGIDPEAEVRDRQNRPVQLNRGRVIESLFTGAAG